MTRNIQVSDPHRISLGEALETALGALHYASRCQEMASGDPQEFHDWGWVFVEITETLYAVNKGIDRQLVAHPRGTLAPADRARLQQIRGHLALLGVALADAGTHARGFYELASRFGSVVTENAQNH
ncbi:MAG TPA: hypothetical protein VFE65_14725 [Pseudonocardia sp.]|nr:hypothetical protein [Pseudonocardia sp.]